MQTSNTGLLKIPFQRKYDMFCGGASKMRLEVVLKSYQSRMNVVSNTTFIPFRYIKKMILL